LRIRVGDAHCHLNPIRGLGVNAFSKKFIGSGGWFLALVNLPSWSYGINASRVKDYEKIFRLNISTARSLREKGLKVSVILGVHPAEVARLVDMGASLEKAIRLAKDAYRLAASLVEKGCAEGLGEVGRPHWPAAKSLIDACNDILDYVLRLAEELDCLVHIHAERRGLETIRDIAGRAPRGCRVVMHHAEGRYAREAYRHGLYPSVPARLEELIGALEAPLLVVESDFLDDPKRPGAVIAPWSISRTFRRLVARGYIDLERAEDILVKNIEEIYSVAI